MVESLDCTHFPNRSQYLVRFRYKLLDPGDWSIMIRDVGDTSFNPRYVVRNSASGTTTVGDWIEAEFVTRLHGGTEYKLQIQCDSTGIHSLVVDYIELYALEPLGDNQLPVTRQSPRQRTGPGVPARDGPPHDDTNTFSITINSYTSSFMTIHHHRDRRRR